MSRKDLDQHDITTEYLKEHYPNYILITLDKNLEEIRLWTSQTDYFTNRGILDHTKSILEEIYYFQEDEEDDEPSPHGHC